MQYMTSVECKAQSSLAGIDALPDAELNALLVRASALVDAVTKQTFALQSGVVKFFEGSGSRRLVMPERVLSLTEVKFLSRNEKGAVIGEEVAFGFFPKFWWINASTRIFPIGEQNIKITGDFGYAAVPVEIQTATCLITEQIFRLDGSGSGAGLGTFDREKIGDYEYELPDAGDQEGLERYISIMVPAEARILLSRFKKPPLITAVRGSGSARLEDIASNNVEDL